MELPLKVYLAGEIHSDWRDELARDIASRGLPVELLAPVTDHQKSDEAGVAILGQEPSAFWKDHKSAGINSLRIGTALARADVVVVRFGERYRQWNAAFDAGRAVAMGKGLITLHSPELDHALKEIDQAAAAVCRSVEQVAATLAYVTTQP